MRRTPPRNFPRVGLNEHIWDLILTVSDLYRNGASGLSWSVWALIHDFNAEKSDALGTVRFPATQAISTAVTSMPMHSQ